MHSSGMRTVCCSGRLWGVCLPRGCLPGECLTKGDVCPGEGMSVQGRGCLSRGLGVCLRRVSAQGDVYLGGVYPGGVCPEGCLPRGCTPPCGQTDACENNTFLQLLLRMVNMLVGTGTHCIKTSYINVNRKSP